MQLVPSLSVSRIQEKHTLSLEVKGHCTVWKDERQNQRINQSILIPLNCKTESYIRDQTRKAAAAIRKSKDKEFVFNKGCDVQSSGVRKMLLTAAFCNSVKKWWQKDSRKQPERISLLRSVETIRLCVRAWKA